MTRFLVSAALALAVASCSDATGPHGLRLTMSVDRTQVARDGSVEVTLTATNTSNRAVTVVSPDSYGACMRAFRVFTAAQREVQVETFLCALLQVIGPLPMELAPGQSVTARDNWEPGRSTLDGQPLPTGTYRIVGHYHVEDALAVSAPESITVVP
jgi:hypothetical protein